MFVLFIVLFSFGGPALAVQTTPVQQKDSYLSAYSELHQTPNNIKSDRDYSLGQNSDFSSHGYAEGPVYRPEGSYPPSAPQYGPPKPEYGPPKSEYGPALQQYGPPKQEYGPPVPQYGPPKPEYGLPQVEFGHPKPIYGPPKPIYGPPTTG